MRFYSGKIRLRDRYLKTLQELLCTVEIYLRDLILDPRQLLPCGGVCWYPKVSLHLSCHVKYYWGKVLNSAAILLATYRTLVSTHQRLLILSLLKLLFFFNLLLISFRDYPQL